MQPLWLILVPEVSEAHQVCPVPTPSITDLLLSLHPHPTPADLSARPACDSMLFVAGYGVIAEPVQGLGLHLAALGGPEPWYWQARH